MDENGIHCLHCNGVFPAIEVVEESVKVLVDEPWGRAPSLVEQVQFRCPTCRSSSIEAVWLCNQCLQREPVEGTDHCLICTPVEEYDGV